MSKKEKKAIDEYEFATMTNFDLNVGFDDFIQKAVNAKYKNQELIALQKIIERLQEIRLKQQKEINREKQYSEFYKDLCNKQQKEIEEKSTIIMAGAEKVKQLEKEIEKLKKELKDVTSIPQDDIEYDEEGNEL